VAIARALGPTGSGAITLLLLFNVTTGMILNIGLGQAAVYYVGLKSYSPHEVANNLFSITWIISIPITILLIGCLPLYADKLFYHIPKGDVILILALTPLALGRLYAEYVFIALHDFVWNNSLNLMDLGIRLVFVTAFLPFGLNLHEVIVVIVLSTIVSFVAGWYKISRKLGHFRLRIKMPLLKRFANFGVPAYASVLVTFLNLRIDQFLVGYFLRIDQLGVYMIAVIIAELPMKIANAITKVLFAQVSSMNPEEATVLTNRTIRAVIIIALLIGIGLLLTGAWIIRAFFSVKFSGAASALSLLLPGAVFFNFTQILYSDLSGRGKPGVGIYTSLISLFITIVGNVIFTPRMGINGAAITSSFSYCVAAIIIIWIYLRTSGQTLRQVMYLTLDDVNYVSALIKGIYR
jgi:O-antigen/teichoic acid export membrane protein